MKCTTQEACSKTLQRGEIIDLQAFIWISFPGLNPESVNHSAIFNFLSYIPAVTNNNCSSKQCSAKSVRNKLYSNNLPLDTWSPIFRSSTQSPSFTGSFRGVVIFMERKQERIHELSNTLLLQRWHYDNLNKLTKGKHKSMSTMITAPCFPVKLKRIMQKCFPECLHTPRLQIS